MDKRKREKVLIRSIAGISAVCMAVVFVLFIRELRAHNSLIAEYDAAQVLAMLAERYAQLSIEGTPTGDAFAIENVDPRIKSFGIYLPSGEAVITAGNAPNFLDPLSIEQRQILKEKKTQILRLTRPIGGMRMGFDGRNQGRGHMGGMTGPQRIVLMDYDITAFAQDNVRLTVLFSILGGVFILILFLLLAFYRRIEQYQRSEEEHRTLLQLGEAARTLAHEIKNPLGTLRVQASIIGKNLPEKYSQSLSIMKEEISRISSLTDRVGEFLKNPLGNPIDIELSEFLTSLVKRFPFPVSLSFQDSAKHSVYFDPERLRSVVENIIWNAKESMETSTPVEAVEVSVETVKRTVQLHVMDRGKGIPPELKERVFDPFFTTKVKGQGVGLAVSKQFVEAAGGSLTFAHRPGGGTIFTVHFKAEGKE